MGKSFIEKIFDSLSSNKKFPNYQAERRIDIFINHFIERIMSKYLSSETAFICPEFPLKKIDNKRSTKLDYLCKTESEIIFVELKTDAISFKESQAKIYLEINWQNCLKDLQIIIDSQRIEPYKKKYALLKDKIQVVSNYLSPIRVIYLSPMPSNLNLKFLKIENPKSLGSLNINLTKDERIAWNFLIELDMYVFEMRKLTPKELNA